MVESINVLGDTAPRLPVTESLHGSNLFLSYRQASASRQSPAASFSCLVCRWLPPNMFQPMASSLTSAPLFSTTNFSDPSPPTQLQVSLPPQRRPLPLSNFTPTCWLPTQACIARLQHSPQSPVPSKTWSISASISHLSARLWTCLRYSYQQALSLVDPER